MEIYLVGGAVRDQLLGRPVKEKDYVVVGATPDELLARGYTPVGKDFPVFLHPKTKEEYALARTERKTGKGYTGFECHAAPDVTLEQDLLRRDLTINAMAQTEDGKIIDPYNGQTDLKNKLLKHVSPAFAEDPLRILRLARFAARFEEFNVHPETMTLMKTMVKQGEVDALVSERVFKELEKALNEKEPQRFFEMLKACGAHDILFPELTRTKDLAIAAQMTDNPVIRFATLAYQVAPEKIEALDARLKLPREYRDLALLVSKFHDDYSDGFKKDADGLLSLLEKTDAFRRPDRFEDFITACQAADYHDAAKPLRQRWMGAFNLANSVSTQPFQDQNLKGQDFANALRAARIEAIGKL